MKGIVYGCVGFLLSLLSIGIISLLVPSIVILLRLTYLGVGLCALIGGAITAWIVQNKGLKYGFITGIVISIILIFVELGYLIENFVGTLPFLIWYMWFPVLCCASIGGCIGEYLYKLKKFQKKRLFF